MEFDAGSSVLFVGEGDFSFTETLSRLNSFDNITAVATCYQQEATDRTLLNIQKLQERGVEVIPGVDATKLHISTNINLRRFSFVVFNFPHVGGKMKIHLNRKLLSDFFNSVTSVLMKTGQVIITLCAGQGGIPLDPVSRRWDDTWQVVLMASQADLVLRKVGEFDASIYHGYSPTGYRSMEKGFSQSGAITYTFERGPEVDSCSQNCLCTEKVWLCNGSIAKVPLFLFSQMKRDMCYDSSTLIGQLCSLVQKHISKLVTLQHRKDIVMDENMQLSDILNCFSYYVPEIQNETAFVHPLYVLKRTPMFDLDILLVFIYRDKLKIIEKILFENFKLEIRNCSKSFSFQTKSFIWRDFVLGPYSLPIKIPSTSETSSSVMNYCENFNIFAVNIKQLAHLYFEVEADELWSHRQEVSVDNSCVIYSPYSLFPLEYVYDLSFWQCKSADSSKHTNEAVNLMPKDLVESQFSLGFEETVGVIVVNTARDSLVDYRLLSTYFHPGNNRRSFTYRIRYRNFCSPLSDWKAKKIHSDIGFKLEQYLRVEVRW